MGGGLPVCRSPWGGKWAGGSPCLSPSLCLPWAGNKASVLGVALAMERVAPIPLRFVLACCSQARSVWRLCALSRVRLSIAVPAGAGGWGVEAGPAPASHPGAAVLPGGGGIIPFASGGVGGRSPRGLWVGWGVGGAGGVAPWLPTSSLWGRRSAAFCPVPLSSPAHPPQAHAFGRGLGAAPGAGCGPPPAGQPSGGGGGEGRPVSRPPRRAGLGAGGAGGSPRLSPSLCPPWAGKVGR